MHTNKKAFTLLELMVAMGILAVLVGLSIIGIQTVQRSLRNTQRDDVMGAVNLKIQDIYTNTGTYPDVVFTPDAVFVDGEEYYKLEGAQKGTTSAEGTTPAGTAYCYEILPNRASYTLAVQREGSGWNQFGLSDSSLCTTNKVVSGV